jgi:hypothetical protein
MISLVILAPRKAGDIVAGPIRIAVPGVLVRGRSLTTDAARAWHDPRDSS